MKTRLLSTALLLAAMAAHAGPQSYEIKFAPTKGTKSVFTMAFEIGGTQQTTVYQSMITEEIVDVKEDGSYLTASYQTEHKVFVGGKMVQNSPQTITAVTTYDKSGRPLTIGGDNASPSSYRVANTTSFMYPDRAVAIGETWSVSVPESKDHGSRLTTNTYKLASVEKQGEKQVAVVEVAAAEKSGDSPTTVTGKFWIDLASGAVVRYEAKIQNMPTESGPTYSGHITIVRQ